MVEISEGDSWASVRAAHRWQVPERYNIAEDMVGRWAREAPERTAMIHLEADGSVRELSFRDLDRAACRLAQVLRAHGLRRGERVAVLLPQSPETLMTHLAAYKLGAVVVPLFTLFGEDGLAYRLEDSGARMVVTDRANQPKLDAIRDRLGELAHVFLADGAGEPGSLAPLMAAARDEIEPPATGPEDPAFISYTSGTTGPPKGALHGHRVLLGHVPGVQTVHDFFPQAGDRMWTPADWAWMGGLCNIAMPCLRAGVTLVSHRMERFDPERAFELMARLEVRNAFLPPTALKMMRTVPGPARFGHDLRTVGSGGESLGAEVLDWGRSALGLQIHEFYGQTECNKVLGNNARLAPVRPGSMGLPLPGSDVTILDEEGNELGPGETGEIAIHRRDAAMFLGYWKLPEKTAEKFVGDWMRTGDEGMRDAEGYFWFGSRTDDVITSSGYRIGPTEIENCLTGHPSVGMAACIGVPDPVRTEIVRAYVTLAPGAEGTDQLKSDLRDHVRTRLSPHLAPREVVFIERMPMTATGKIRRRELRGK